MVNIEDITYTTRGKTILKNINFAANSNALTAIIGENGGGKSMLLKIILGIIKPTQGRVAMPINTKLAYMPQSIFVSRHLPITVKDFILLHCSKNINMQVAEELNIVRIFNKHICDVSGGERQKALFVATISQDADVFILDEPEQNLDLDSKVKIFDAIKHLCTHKTVIMVSHDIASVFDSQAHIICLNKTIHCQGTSSQLSHENIRTVVPLMQHFFSHYHRSSHTCEFENPAN